MTLPQRCKFVYLRFPVISYLYVIPILIPLYYGKQYISHICSNYFYLWGYHHIMQGVKTIINVHHWQSGIGFKITCMMSSGQSVMENLNSIICNNKKDCNLNG